jgi:hypothetical protein
MPLVEEVRKMRERVAARIGELEPLVAEYQELCRVADELGVAVPASAHSDALAPPSPRRPARATKRPAAPATRAESPPRGKTLKPPRARAPRRAQTPAHEQSAREKQVLDVIRARPGATVADVARALDVEATALYRVVRKLTIEGAITKRARGLFPAA